MGLDNGICIRCEPDKKDFYVNYFIDVDGDYDNPEICYWRKCWNVREAILNVLHAKPDQFEFKIEADDIKPIIRKLLELMDKEVWDGSDESIWEFDEIKDTLVKQIANLHLLRKLFEKEPDLEVYFYDSY